MSLYSPLMTFTEKMLDVSTLKHRVISNNIANINTSGFKRSEVSFQQALEVINQSLNEQPTDLYEEIKGTSIDDSILENLKLDDLYERSKRAGDDLGVNFALGDATFDHHLGKHTGAVSTGLEEEESSKARAATRDDIIKNVQPFLVTKSSSERLDGNNVSPEIEIGKMIKNTSFYNVLVSSISGEFRSLKTIITNR